MEIFLVEDEKSLQSLLLTYLIDAGYKVKTFDNGIDALAHVQDTVDLWILDIMLPGIDGFALIKKVKEYNPNVPVIFMSARSEELDRVIGLEMGCDDYLPKPFLPRELVLRVYKLLTRVNRSSSNMTVGPYIFDKAERVLKFEGKSIELSVKEYDLIELLVTKVNKAQSRTDILDNVWGENYFGSERVVDDTIRRMRKKAPELPFETVYGFGYIYKGK